MEDSTEQEEMAVRSSSYPGYQLYEDSTGTTYCSPKKVRNQMEGSAWMKLCLMHHQGARVMKPWVSNQQSGTIWP